MDRYTIKNKDGYDLDANLYVQGECAVFNGAIERLGQYEDTGLMPGQIWEMDKLYREMYSEKCREVAELKKRLEQQEEKRYCCTCRYYETAEGVCCNAKSEHCADFRSLDDTCVKRGGDR